MLMSTVIDSLETAQLRRAPAFDAGDRVRVHFQVVEGTRRRTQVFEGVVIRRQGHGVRETFTVRKQSFGVGVERTFPLHSPKIERIEVAARGDVRRAKLYYLRGRVGKRARVRERRHIAPDEAIERSLLREPAADQPEEAGDLAGEPLEPEATAEAEAAEQPDVAVAGAAEQPEVAVEGAAEQPEAAVDPEAGAGEAPHAGAAEAQQSADEAPAPADEAPEPPDQSPEPTAEATAHEEQPESVPEAGAESEVSASDTGQHSE